MYSLKSKARKLNLPVDLQCDLFDAMVVPILLYGSEVWGFQTVDQINVFHRKFLKCLLRVNKGTPNCMIYGELGRKSLDTFIEKRMINFWIRILDSNSNKLSSTMYQLMKNMYDKDVFKSNWLTKIKSILDKCGFSNLWSENMLVNHKWMKHSIELRIDDMYKQNWSSEVDTNRLCNIYRLFKSDFKIEQYISKLPVNDCLTLSKFRCSNSRLPINFRRFEINNLPKYCTLCNCGDVGDEMHYILICNAFAAERSMYIKKCFYTRPNVGLLMFKELFQSTNYNVMANLVKFINIIISKF